MRDEDVIRVIDRYEAYLSRESVVPATPFPTNESLDVSAMPLYDADRHLLYMFREMRRFAAEGGQTEKLMRWLGFAQGVLWGAGEYSLDELKNHNRPQGLNDDDE